MGKKTPELTPDSNKIIVEIRQEGFKQSQIASVIWKSQSTVSKFLERFNAIDNVEISQEWVALENWTFGRSINFGVWFWVIEGNHWWISPVIWIVEY